MCLQNNSKREVRILINFSGNVNNGRRNRVIRFGDDPGYCLDPGIFKGFFIIALTINIAGVVPWWRYALSECSCYIWIVDNCLWMPSDSVVRNLDQLIYTVLSNPFN